MYLLFDIGGTHTRIAFSKDTKTISEPIIYHTPQNYQEGLDQLEINSKKLLGRDFEEIKLVCGGIAGTLSEDKSTFLSGKHISGWDNKPFKHHLEEIFKCEALIENDAALGGLGETVHGSGKDFNIVAFLTIGTGVGGARIVDGKIDRNFEGFEPGRMIVDGVHTLENLVSGFALEKRYGIKSGDIEDNKVWQEVTRWVSIGINNLIVEWSPEVIILGGSLSQRIDLGQLNLHLKKLQPFPNLPPIKKAIFGQTSTLYGALEYANKVS